LLFLNALQTLPAEYATLFRDLLSWLALAALAWVTGHILEASLRAHGLIAPDEPPAERLARRLAVLLAALTFYPAIRAFTLGQIQSWVNMLLALAMICWIHRRPATAGWLVGLTALLKMQYGLIFAWSLICRQWRLTVAGLGVVLLGLALSILFFGWENHIEYVRGLEFVGRRGEAYFPNQSVNGILNRIASLEDPERFNNIQWKNTFPPYTPWIYRGTLIASLILLLPALFAGRKPPDARDPTDFGLFLLSLTMAAPVAWEHHYGILLPLYAWMLPAVIRQKPWGRWSLPILGLSYMLTSNLFLMANLLADTRFNILQSYLFIGALLALLTLYRLRFRRFEWSGETNTAAAPTRVR
jgi:hypothetical protein